MEREVSDHVVFLLSPAPFSRSPLSPREAKAITTDMLPHMP